MGFNFGKVLGALKQVGLPLIANALPGGGFVEAGVEAILGEKLVEGNEDNIVAKIQDPVLQADLFRFQLDHELELKRLDFESDELDVDDTKDARKRDVELQKARGGNRRSNVLAYLAVGGFLVNIGLLYFVTVPVSTEKALWLMLGVLGAIVKDIYHFEYGSSRGSRNKDVVLANGSGHLIEG